MAGASSPTFMFEVRSAPIIPAASEPSPIPLTDDSAAADRDSICAEANEEAGSSLDERVGDGGIADRAEDEPSTSSADSSEILPDEEELRRSEDGTGARDESWRFRREPPLRRLRGNDRRRGWYEIPERESVRGSREFWRRIWQGNPDRGRLPSPP
jgi:hypothetical protein